jgi:predicted thioesterase
MTESFTPGMRGRAETIVTESDTAIALRSGDVNVLGTPRLIALCEEASIDAVSGALEAGQTTVGARVQLDHVAPSHVGDTIVATASLETIEGSRLMFSVHASDGEREVGRGVIVRFVVDRERFGG